MLMRSDKSSDPNRMDREDFTDFVARKNSKPNIKHVDSIIRFFLDELAKRAKLEDGFKINNFGTLKLVTKPSRKFWNEFEKEYQMSKEIRNYLFTIDEKLSKYLEEILEIPEKKRYLRNRHKFK